MRHYPVFLDTTGQRIVVVGGGDTAVAKLRLLMKSEARISVIDEAPCDQLKTWASEGRIRLIHRAAERQDYLCARLVYAATDDPRADAQIADAGRAAGALVNIVDNLEGSDFITPAIVDRDPVVVAIGTEGTAPVLARSIKADVEGLLPASLGLLARIGAGFRGKAAHLPSGRLRRDFWSRFFFKEGPRALESGSDAVDEVLDRLYDEAKAPIRTVGRVAFVGAGPGDPDLLTRKALRLLHEADVVIHDRLVSPQIMELARREAIILEVGKTGFGPSWSQADINEEIVRHARDGHQVVRLKGGDPTVFGRLDEETAVLDEAGIVYDIVPGITAASAAAASLGVSLTARGRNSGYRLLTAHDLNGFAEQDWRSLSAPGSVAAIYMGKKAAKFLSGRLMMFGADPQTPVTAVENASLPNARRIEATVNSLASELEAAGPEGPVVILFGISGTKAMDVAGHAQEVAAQ